MIIMFRILFIHGMTVCYFLRSKYICQKVVACFKTLHFLLVTDFTFLVNTVYYIFQQGTFPFLLNKLNSLICNFMFWFFNSKAVTCLAHGISGNYLISGSEDGVVRVWDAKTLNIVRVLKHAKGYSIVVNYCFLACEGFFIRCTF